VGSSSPQADGSLTSSADVNVADLNLQMGALASSILGLPPAATTFEVKVATGVKLDFTPVSFQLSPALDIGQSARIVPINYLTYNFQDPATGNPMNVDVLLNGVDQGPVSSIRYRPGIDSLGVQFFHGNRIKVVPQWTFQAQLTNELDLLASLHATLTVGELSGSVFGKSFQLGPVYQLPFNLGSARLATLAQRTFNVIDTSSTPLTLPSFTIGDTFSTSLAVKHTADDGVAESLRFAVESANSLAISNPSLAYTIQVPAGIYLLSRIPTVAEGAPSKSMTARSRVTRRWKAAGSWPAGISR
jgi:hypothetical protein